MFIILHYYVNVELESSVTDGYGRVWVVQGAFKGGARGRWRPNLTSTVPMSSRPKRATMCDKVCNLNKKRLRVFCV